jgi:hypothetical protein
MDSSLTKAERRERLKSAMTAAKSSGAPWFEYANIMIRASEGAEDDDEIMDLGVASQEAIGLSSQILKRFVELLRKTQKLAATSGNDLSAVLSPVFNSQEVAVRLYHRSPKVGLETLHQLVKGELTLKQIRTKLVEAPADLAKGEMARYAMSKSRGANMALIESSLEANAEQLWGPGSQLRKRLNLMYLSRNGYEIIGNDGSVVAGVDSHYHDPRLNRDSFSDNAAASLLLAPFFASFYFAFAPTADEGVVRRATALLDWFDYGWVGLLIIRRDGTIDRVRESRGSPKPNMTSRYEAFKRKFPAKKTWQGSKALQLNADH